MTTRKMPQQSAGPERVGTVCAVNASLTLVFLDGEHVPAWEPLLDEPREDDLGGHPQRVHAFYEADDEFTNGTLKVGDGRALVVRLEGATGEAEIYRLTDGTLVFAEPPRAWWDDEDNYGANASEVAALFSEAIARPVSSAKRIGKVEVATGKLVAFDSNGDVAPAAKALKKAGAAGKLARFGRDDAGVIAVLRPGTYTVRRRVFERRWAKDQPLVVAYLETGAKRTNGTKPVGTKVAARAKGKSTTAAKQAAPRGAKKTMLTPSAHLAAVIGAESVPRVEITKRLWKYILANKLLDKKLKTTINADAKLKKIFGKAQVSMFEVPALIDRHLR